MRLLALKLPAISDVWAAVFAWGGRVTVVVTQGVTPGVSCEADIG